MASEGCDICAGNSVWIRLCPDHYQMQDRLRIISDYHAPHREKWGDKAPDYCADCFLLSCIDALEPGPAVEPLAPRHAPCKPGCELCKVLDEMDEEDAADPDPVQSCGHRRLDVGHTPATCLWPKE